MWRQTNGEVTKTKFKRDKDQETRDNTSIEIFPQNFEFFGSADMNQNQENQSLKEQRQRKFKTKFKKTRVRY